MSKEMRTLAIPTALVAIIVLAALPVHATDEDGVATPAGPGPSTIQTEDTGSLTTTFVSDNQYAGNTFDIENITTVDVTITGWDVNMDPPGGTNTIDIYWRVGTANGFESDPTGWTLLGSDPNVVSNGIDMPTPVSMPDFTIQPGELFGFYLVLSTYVPGGGTVIRYTNGGPTTYQNTELALTTYHGLSEELFGTTVFFPRMWNGTVHYDFVPVELQSFTIE